MYLNRAPERSAFESIYVNHYKQDSIPFRWQVNDDYTLVYITQGNGRRFIGDSMSDFQAGELIIIPPRIPFAFISDYEYINGGCQFIWMRFHPQFAGEQFFSIPETSLIAGLLNKASKGLVLNDLGDALSSIFLEITKMTRLNRFLTLVTFLDSLANLPSETLVSENYKACTSEEDMNRVHEVCGYMNLHYQKGLSAEQIGALIHMSAPSFCRFFKRVMNKTFHYYLCEIRIALAQRLLLSTDMYTEDIGKRCGFKTNPSFTARFKDYTDTTPAVYRKTVLAK
jgi:AraC-like DNA-binding protein